LNTGVGVGTLVGVDGGGVDVGVGNAPEGFVGTVSPSGVAVGRGTDVAVGAKVGRRDGGTLVGVGSGSVASGVGVDSGIVGNTMGAGVDTSGDGPRAPHANPIHGTKMVGTRSLFGMQSSWAGLQY
jgi:hypothetical protein